jgi:hypothetical protein
MSQIVYSFQVSAGSILVSRELPNRHASPKQALTGTPTKLWPGIDIDIPTGRTSAKSTPAGTRDAVLAAFRAGSDGVILSRKWSEMKSANLKAAGEAVKQLA